MASGLSFTVKRNRFPQAPAAMARGVERGSAKAGDHILAQAKATVPVDTGALRESHRMEATDEGLTISAGADHALYVHEGTRRMGARPWLREAVERGMPTFERDIAAAADAELAR